MAETKPTTHKPPPRTVRWWPGIWLVSLTVLALIWVRVQAHRPFQERNILTAEIVLVSMILLLVWWTFFSRAPNRIRLGITGAIVGLLVLGALLFRVRGLSGDLVPILEFRWANRGAFGAQATATNAPAISVRDRTNDFPQFLGPDRNGVLAGPRLETNWLSYPPAVLWRQKVGAAWSGFVIVGEICLTQEQRGEEECVVAYELKSGQQLWLHSDKALYKTVVAGEGPRATPTVVSNRVFTFGATCLLNCLDLSTGSLIWTRNLLADGGKVPDWGGAGSPLVVDGQVIVHGGDNAPHSLYAFRAEDGQPVWTGGTANPSYTSPSLATLAGVRQVLAFNHRSVSGHDLLTGATLWEKPWGSGNAVCALPVVVGDNQVLFSSGYGFGAELLEISSKTNSKLAVKLLWKSIRMKAKFSHLFARNGFLYGLDDGIFACVDLKDGSQRWKEGRYGHGQGLFVGDLYLLMAESGELVLLRPTPDSPNELTRYKVFNAKTWNPMALSGDLLLVRNDLEVACLRLPLLKE
ncbi:MAG: PQQ-binding-like beta-propeller repeat protein [Verrucomicrobiota bacterium]